MKKHSVLILGYSESLAGGVSKVTNFLVRNMEEMELHPVLVCYHPKVKSLVTAFYCLLTFTKKITIYTKQYKIIVVIIGSLGDTIRTLPYIWLSLLARKKVCIQFHTSTEVILKQIRPISITRLVLFTWRKVSLHCLLSKELESQLKKRVGYGVNSTIIANAMSDKWLSSEPLPFMERNRDIIFFGRWSADKGVYDLAAAMSKIQNKALCEMYTDAPTDEKYDNCILSAWVDEDEVHNIMKTSKLLVLPSYAEAYPTVLLEAVACGTPFIATNVGGIPDIATGSKCGVLFEPGDIEDLAVKIDSILKDQSSWENFASFDKKWIELHNIENIKMKWRKIFSELSN